MSEAVFLYTGDFRKVTSMHRKKRRICLDFFLVVFIRQSLILFISFFSVFLFSSFVACSQSAARRAGPSRACDTFYTERVLTPAPDVATALTRASVMLCLSPVGTVISLGCHRYTDTAYPITSLMIAYSVCFHSCGLEPLSVFPHTVLTQPNVMQ